MLDVPALRDLYDAQLRPAEATGLGARTVVETDGPVVRILGGHRGFVSGPPDLGVTGLHLTALVARQRDVFAARGEAVEWKTRAHDRPELIDALMAAGFVPEEVETVLVGSARAAAGIGSALPAGVGVRIATADADMVRIAGMESLVWGADWSWLATDLIERVAPRSVTVFVAEAEAGETGQTMVGAAWLAWQPGTEFPGLWGGSTRAGWRRRGIYRALVAGRAVLAVGAGVRYLQVDASDDSRPVLERLGFVAVTTTTPYVWIPPG